MSEWRKFGREIFGKEKEKLEHFPQIMNKKEKRKFFKLQTNTQNVEREREREKERESTS